MPWRLYNSQDKPSVDTLLVQMEQRLGQPVDVPQLNIEPVLAAYVYEKDGKITHVAFLEAEAEIQTLGECPLPIEEWDEAGALLLEKCQRYKLRFVRAFIPNQVLKRNRPKRPKAIERILQHFGFDREDHSKITAFTRWTGKE